MRVSFTHDPARSGGSVATIVRTDGVSLQMRSYDRKYRVPHDLVHFVAELEFRLDRGVWGSVAAGAVFDSMKVVAGRPRHDSGPRSREVLRANRDEINLAERVAGAVHGDVDPPATGARQLGADAEIRAAWEFHRAGPPPFPPEVLRRAVGRLDALGTRWQQLGDDERLDLDWTLPVVRLVVRPAVPKRRRR